MQYYQFTKIRSEAARLEQLRQDIRRLHEAAGKQAKAQAAGSSSETRRENWAVGDGGAALEAEISAAGSDRLALMDKLAVVAARLLEACVASSREAAGGVTTGNPAARPSSSGSSPVLGGTQQTSAVPFAIKWAGSSGVVAQITQRLVAAAAGRDILLLLSRRRS